MGIGNDYRRECAKFVALFAVACIVFYAVVRWFNITSSVCDGFFPYADAMMNGVFPYTEDVWAYDEWRGWEYPPLAYVFLFIPRLFATTPGGYEGAFIVMAALFFAIGVWYSGKLSRLMGHRSFSGGLIFTAMMLLMLEFNLDRYDIFPMVLTLVAIYCFSSKRYIWAYALIAIAAMTKLYPALLLPLFMISMMMSSKWVETAKGVLVAVAVVLLSFIPTILAGGDATMFLTYHMDRPLEMESVVASFIEVLDLIGITDISYVFSFGSDNIVGSLPDAISPLMTPLMAVVCLALMCTFPLCLKRLKSKCSDTEINRCMVGLAFAFLMVAAFIIFGKVLSGQYIIWLIPFMIVLIQGSKDGKDRRILFELFIAVEVLTQIDFAVNFGARDAGEAMSAVGVLIVFVRNVLLLALFYYVIRHNTCLTSLGRRANL